jgi:hypothetical protein
MKDWKTEDHNQIIRDAKRRFLAHYFPDHKYHHIEVVYYSMNPHRRFGCSCGADLEIDHMDVDWDLFCNEDDDTFHALLDFRELLSAQALAVYNNLVNGSILKLPATESTPARLVQCQYMGRTVHVDESWTPPSQAVQEFATMFNRLIEARKVDYGVALHARAVPLPRIDRRRRTLLLLYVFSDHSMEELNAWCKVCCFVREGELPEEW